MGLLLSVLVVCVGVLEVLACVRHFQDGYLPLWTPHCAVTSGYTASYERWRKKPSDSCEFRSFDDVDGALYPAENELSENCLAVSSNIQNGFTGKQIEKSGENVSSYTDFYYQQSKTCSGNGLSHSIDDRTKEVISCHNIGDILASSLEPDEGELKLINKNVANIIPADCIPDAREHSGKTQEAVIPEFSSDLTSDKNSMTVSTENRVMISHTQTEGAGPLSVHEFERTFSRDNGIDKYSISDKEIDIENEVIVLNSCDELYTSTRGVINEGNSETGSSDGILGGNVLKQNDSAVIVEENLEFPSSLCGEHMLETAVRDTSLNAVVKTVSHVPVLVTESNVSVSDSVTERNSGTVPSSDFVADKLFTGVLKLEDQIQPTSPGVLSPLYLQTQEDKSIMGCVERDLPSTAGEVFDKPDGTVSSSRNESLDSACVNNERGSQNSSIRHVLNEESSITPVKVISQCNVQISDDGLEFDQTDASGQPVSLLESPGFETALSDINIQTEPETCVSAECAELHLGTEAFDSTSDDLCSSYGAESGADIQECSVISGDENVGNVTFEDRPRNETGIGPEDGAGTKHAVLDPSIAREPSSPDIQNEKEIGITSEDAEERVSESCLDSQTILTDSLISRDEGPPHDANSPTSGDLSEDGVSGEASKLQASSDILVTPLDISTAGQLPVSIPPLSIGSSFETPVSLASLATDQPSMSPPKVPSTPKKSKADISWPTFFPGTPVIKRPSVTFATPESVFTNDDEYLRQYVEESDDLPCIKMPDDSTVTESESTASTSEGSLSESVGTSERSDSVEDPDTIVYREKSPSSIVSGNDFSRKELKLQRRKSYKQKRYNSAIEIRTRDEEAEDRSFSENNPGLFRASSVREPKKRNRQPAKSSSFEDVLLHDTQIDGVGGTSPTNTTEEMSAVSIPEGGETDHEGRQHDQETLKGTSDMTDSLTISTERNKAKFDESKPQNEEKRIQGNATEGQKEDNKGDDDEEYSFSEEQSSSQQKSPPKEAFWVSREDGTH
jgi:hypothetical protein